MTTKQRYRKAGISDVIGSGFAGYLEASYADLVATFGQPRWRRKDGPWRTSDSKVRCEWAFKIGAGKRRLVFTIYDYKEHQPIEDLRIWHVGAKGHVSRLPEIFAIHKVSLSKTRRT